MSRMEVLCSPFQEVKVECQVQEFDDCFWSDTGRNTQYRVA
jgi:hypothetical protein